MDKAKKRKPKRKRKAVMWVLGTVLALIAGYYFIPNFPLGPYSLYKNMPDSEISAPIPYARLADSSLELGYTPTFKPDADALKRFPGVRDCLVRSEAKAESPDLRLINWNRIRHEKDAEVCLWWIFLSLETPERAEVWMQFHEMGLYESNFVSPNVDFGQALRARTQWDIKRERYRYPTKGHMRFFKPFWHSRFYEIVWDPRGNLVNVYVHLQTV